MVTIRYKLGISLGYLFGDDGCRNSLVFHYQFDRCRILLNRLVFERNDINLLYFVVISSHIIVGLVALIIVRTLRKDIARYNADDAADEAMEQSGWKLVHGDIFRPPKYPRLFVATIGSGVQIFLMSLITICKYIMRELCPNS